MIDVCVSDASTTKGEDCIDSGMPPGLCGALFDYTGGYTGPHSELSESEPCPEVPELTATAFTTPSYFTVSTVMVITKKHLPITKHMTKECTFVLSMDLTK